MERVKKLLSIPEAGISVILLCLVVFFQLMNPVFLTQLNIVGMLRAMAYPGIIAVGMALCLISGVIDLSVGATAGLASVIFAYTSVYWHFGFIPALLTALLCGFLVGLMNGLIITRLNITPFIMTICSMYVVRGLASWISNGFTIYPLPDGFAEIGSLKPLGVSVAFFVMIGVMLIAAYFLDHTVWGLTVRATGSDKESAKCTEVDVNSVHLSVFVITGVVSALAGVMVSLIINSGIATTGTGWELIAVAACAIGGVSLFGYEGSFVGLFLGLLTLQVIQNGIVVIGISPYTQNITIGLILLVSMIFEVRRRRWLNLESV
jgi:ribose transport system permease protein